MRKWRFNFLVLSMVTVITISIVVSRVQATLIDKNFVPQEKTKWCWAASAENSVRAVRTPTHSQKEAVKKIKGTVINPYPNKGGTVQETADAAEYISNYKLDYFGVSTALSFSALNRQNAYGYAPVIIGGNYTDIRTGGHAVILVDCYTIGGTQFIQYYECDKFNAIGGEGLRRCSYNDFCNGRYNGRIYDQTVYNYIC